jgi:hypothetical protein
MANPFPFSSGAVLTAAELNAVGEWTDYTPTTTSWTGSFEYSKTIRIGELVIWKGRFDTDGAQSGTLTMTLPYSDGGLTRGGSGGSGIAYDASADNSFAASPYVASGNLQFIESQANNQTAINSTSPFTWANGDSIRWLAFYETDA